jgi:hypothetical protein
MKHEIIYYPETLSQIENAKLPKTVNAALRRRTRKEIAVEIRNLFKRMGIQHISVTTPNYSMAQAVDIRLPDTEPWEGAHERRHAEIDAIQGVYVAYGDACDLCKRRAAARRKIEKIILAAFPDLDDRSDTQTDYFDYRLSIQ